MSYTNIILVVTNERKLVKSIKRNLSARNYNILIANNTKKTEKFLKKTEVSLVIVDFDMSEINGFEIFSAIKKYSPNAKGVILKTSDKENSNVNRTNVSGALSYFEKPIDFPKLIDHINNCFSDQGLTGNVNEINLFDFIQMVALSNKQKLISVANPNITSLLGLIYIKNGQIIHAEFGNLEGETALPKILAMKKGYFSDMPWVEPEKRTINMEIQEILKGESSDIKTKSKINILVVDDDRITLLIIRDFLNKQGYNLHVSQSAIEATKIISENNIDLVLTDINMPEINGFEFLIWLNKYSPKTQAIVMTSTHSAETKSFAKGQGAIKYFEKPLNLKELAIFLEKITLEEGFTGSVKHIGIIDFFKMISYSYDKKLLSIIEPNTNKAGLVYFNNGNVIHAQLGNYIGEKALYQILKIKKGIFSDMPWMEPEKETINQNLNEILIRIKKLDLKQIDLEKIVEEEDKHEYKKPDPPKNLPQKLNRESEQMNALIDWKTKNKTNNNLGIHESGVALGVIVGKSTKQQVIETLKGYTKTNYLEKLGSQIFFFEDIGVSVHFNNYEIVEEMRFEDNYSGSTSKGIKIGDSLKKALETYGKPRVSTNRGAIWNNIAVYCQLDNKISSIRLKSLEFFKFNNNPIEKNPNEKNLNNGIDKTIDIKNQITDKVKETKVIKFDEIIIDEYEKSIFNIKVNLTSKKQVLEEMKKYTGKEIPGVKTSLINYDELGFTFSFGSNSLLKEININERFEGQTKKGLIIGDSYERVKKLYGEPKIFLKDGGVWDDFSIFWFDNCVTSIRLSSNL